MVRSKSFIATPPGATIKEQLLNRGMSQREFAARMEMSEKHISRLINGEVGLTTDVAIRLEMVLGLPAQFWNNLESIYREKLEKIKQENEMDEDLEILKKIPYNEMALNGWVKDTKDTNQKVVELRKFFEVIRLGLLQEKLHPQIACRRQAITDKSYYALFAWAQEAKREARKITTNSINLAELENQLDNIRKMTMDDPQNFCAELEKKLSCCGIAIVFLPHIGGSFLHGATFYDGNKIIIGLTVRGKDADKFWFSLFHEIGHILLGHINNAYGTTTGDEDAANEFAKERLIPKESFERFCEYNHFDKKSIIRFSNEISIAPGIVVGRLQKENKIPYSWHNDLKVQYQIN